MSKTFGLTLDLIDDPKLIAAYEEYHRSVPPAIVKSLYDAGILFLDIYRWNNRLFMTMVTDDKFSFEKKKQIDDSNPEVQTWENLMWTFQQALPGAKAGEKWQLMNQIFEM